MSGHPCALTLEHRPPPHVHRWRARCACGWKASPRRRKREAEALYRHHVDGLAKHTTPGRIPGPRPLTPVHDLPAELRP